MRIYLKPEISIKALVRGLTYCDELGEKLFSCIKK